MRSDEVLSGEFYTNAERGLQIALIKILAMVSWILSTCSAGFEGLVCGITP